VALPPSLTIITPQPNAQFSPTIFQTLQTNIQNFGMQFMPLSGGVFVGPVLFSVGQTLPGSGVLVPNPSYPHTGVHQTLLDHVNDPMIHLGPSLPLTHAFTHAVSGADPLYGDQTGVSAGLPGITIKGYVDTAIANVTQNLIAPVAASTWYEIGGFDPLYGNLISINAASGSIDIKTYVDTSLTNALAGPFPLNPSFQSVTLSSTGNLLFTGAAGISSSGSLILTTDAVNLNLSAPTSGGLVTVGSYANPAGYGAFGPSGYTVGSTNIGPLGGAVNGSLAVNGDLSLSRSAAGNSAQGQLDFGLTSANAYLSWNADVGSGFMLSQSLQVAGPVTLLASNSLSIENEFMLGTVFNHALTPGLRTDGSNAFLYALDGASLYFGYDNVTLTSLVIGPTGTWGTWDTNGIHIGGSTVNASGTVLSGWLTTGGATVASSGDIGLARSTNSGLLSFGSAAATLDFGVGTAGYFSFSISGSGSASIRGDGTYLCGNSSYGPSSALVSGAISSTRSIAAGTGTTSGGFTFGGLSNNSGLYSLNATTMVLMVSGTTAETITPAGASFAVPLTAAAGVSATTLGTSGNASVGGSLTVAGPMLAGGTTITRYRVKTPLPLGYIAGTIATTGANSVFPATVAIGYTGGQVEAIWMSSLTADGTGTATTLNILQNGTNIGTIIMPGGGTTALSYPLVNPTPVNARDVFQAVVTQAGGATGVYVVLELSEFIS
jgi:hypothetical protein